MCITGQVEKLFWLYGSLTYETLTATNLLHVLQWSFLFPLFTMYVLCISRCCLEFRFSAYGLQSADVEGCSIAYPWLPVSLFHSERGRQELNATEGRRRTAAYAKRKHGELQSAFTFCWEGVLMLPSWQRSGYKKEFFFIYINLQGIKWLTLYHKVSLWLEKNLRHIPLD